MPKKKSTNKRPTQARSKRPQAKSNNPTPKGSRSFSRLRGMKDITSEDYKYWDLVMRKAEDLASVYSFKKISTPILESLSLYLKSTGEDTDIVSKEMYSFVDKNDEKVALRPEITPSLVRAYIENGMFNQPQPLKMFSCGPIFRHEKPQAGRYRQAHQLDFEIFGEENPMADFLLMLIAYNLFSELQINVQLQVNSIGCQECRPGYLKKLTEYYKQRGNRSKLCNDCKKRLTKNPLRLLDCKEEGCKELKAEAPPIIDSLCEDCQKSFTKILEYLDEMDIPYNLNPNLVRGLDYYNRTVFEVWEIEEGQDVAVNELSLAGGGRYDGLVEHMGGRPTPACGFAAGIERTVNRVKANKIPLERKNNNLIFIAQLGDNARRLAISLFEELRKAGFNVKQAFTKDSLKGQLEEANRFGAKLSLILGQKEVNDETILFRDMESGNQEVVDFNKTKPEIVKRMESFEENN